MLYRLIPAILLLIHAASASASDSRDQLWEDILTPSNISVYLYTVQGNTLEEIKNEMLENGPVSVLGKRYYAQAKWLISWYWKRENGRIDYSKTDVIADLQITIPYFSSGNLLLPAWQSFYEASVKHELQHLQHGKNAALEIINLTRSDILSKDGSREYADMKIQKIITEARNNDTYYDRTTGHGLKEGVKI